jgi:wyosine [tRNA(Phe)-imidazoG37] synthetase (radical SAM superfamily)
MLEGERGSSMSVDNPTHLVFGPVPSRRLGHSLGVNNIPHKICTYSCGYCQVGRTRSFRVEPKSFHNPKTIAAAVSTRVREVRDSGAFVDYLTFVPDGEPTLDRNLGRTIGLLKPLGIPVAVISNGSLIDRPEVREALGLADWVSLKVDSVDVHTWRRISRPHRRLSLPAILEGMLAFRRRFPGTLVTETMLVREVNDDEAGLEAVADFLERLNPTTSYLSIPTRPPAESWAEPPREVVIARAFQIFNARVRRTEYLIGYEGDAFAASGDPEADLLSITAVHPMRRQAVETLLHKTGADWQVVRGMIDDGRLVEVEFQQHRYYLRRFPPKLEQAPAPG